jgi:hypothetical protein
MRGLGYNCRNCNNKFSGNYCNMCGEKIYTMHDKSISHFFKEGLHFLTHFEGTLFTTIKTIFKRPGQLSLDYCDGVRKKYFKPLSLFLLLIVIYLFFPIFEGLNMKLKYYPHQDLYGDFAAAKIEQVKAATGLTELQLAEKFHTKGEKTSKFLLLSIIPLTALVFYTLGFFKRKYFFDHMVFAAEVNAFYLLWGFIVLPLLLIIVNNITKWLTGNYIIISENELGIIIYAVICLYFFLAAKRFYGFKWWWCILLTAIFFIAHSFIVYTLYKFLLFLTVINQIH